jgi:uncharacterized membrane protein YedE/YeeE
MAYIRFLLLGIFFGIILIKTQVASWFRIQEMFRFQSFHMFGVIFSAVVILIIVILLLKRFNIKSFNGEPLPLTPKKWSIPRYLVGGIIFGFGWALTGACPGPLYSLIGSGFLIILVPLGSALLGTYVYGLVRDKLPH